MLLNSFDALDNFTSCGKTAIYGIGRIGKTIAEYLSERKIGYIFIDDYVTGINIFRPEEIEGITDRVILAITNTSARSRMLKKLTESVETGVLASPLMEDLERHPFHKYFENNFDPSLFQPSDFLNALMQGYFEGKVAYYNKVNILECYYYNDIYVEKDDVVADVGASCSKYKDNTTLKFAQDTTNTVHAFEPAPGIFEELTNDVQGISNIRIYNIALSDKQGESNFVESAGSSRLLENSNPLTSKVLTDRMDNIIKGRVDFIKMDIEGAELSALKGAENIIKKYKPKLAICVYHYPEDMMTIAKYILSLNLGYKIWIVNNEGNYWMGTKIFAASTKDV